jgi:hypothetical protein
MMRSCGTSGFFPSSRSIWTSARWISATRPDSAADQSVPPRRIASFSARSQLRRIFLASATVTTPRFCGDGDAEDDWDGEAAKGFAACSIRPHAVAMGRTSTMDNRRLIVMAVSGV